MTRCCSSITDWAVSSLWEGVSSSLLWSELWAKLVWWPWFLYWSAGLAVGKKSWKESQMREDKLEPVRYTYLSTPVNIDCLQCAMTTASFGHTLTWNQTEKSIPGNWVPSDKSTIQYIAQCRITHLDHFYNFFCCFETIFLKESMLCISRENE